MTPVELLVVAALFTSGTYLLLQRELTRIVLGLAVLSHGANLVLLLAGGPGGAPPILPQSTAGPMADPLPQALALTAVVISFAVTGLLLAVAFRSWQLTADDEVQDDLEDRRVAREGGDEDVA